MSDRDDAARWQHYRLFGTTTDLFGGYENAAQLDAAVDAAIKRINCSHHWLDARNERVLSGAICLKCGAIRASRPGEFA